MEKKFVYDGVVSGKKVSTWTVPLIDKLDPETNKMKRVPDTHECEEWWKTMYSVENGAFWYKVGEVQG